MAWDVSKLKLSRSVVLDGPAGTVIGLSFGSSGSKMYCVTTSNTVREYDLGMNYDPFTETYLQNIDLTADGILNMQDVEFNPTGSIMYVLDANGVAVYNLSTPWDISTAVYSDLESIPTYSQPLYGWRFKPDGTMVYFVSKFVEKMVGCSLSTAWDISTIQTVQEIELSFGQAGIDFKPDGSKMFISESKTDYIHEYGLTTEWNIETAAYIRSSKCTVLTGNVKFDSDGTTIYINSSGMNEYTLPIGKHRPVKS